MPYGYVSKCITFELILMMLFLIKVTKIYKIVKPLIDNLKELE